MRKLISISYSKFAFNLATFLLRMGLSVFMIPHGYAKLISFTARKDQFMDFLGLGGPISLGLTIFAEFFCSILLLFGLFTRLATIPLLITVFVILSVHHWELFGDHDMVYLFLMGYLCVILVGPGKFSLDGMIGKK